MADGIIVEITTIGDVAIAGFMATSISDSKGITAACAEIDKYIEKNHPRAMVINFEKVKFFSSQVLGVLLAIRDKIEKYHGRIVISAIDPGLHRVFKITNLDKIFEFFPDKESAVSSLNVG